jgi:hypothetical protein
VKQNQKKNIKILKLKMKNEKGIQNPLSVFTTRDRALPSPNTLD